MTRARTTVLLSVIVALLLGIVVYAAFATRSGGNSFAEPKPVDAAAPAGLEQFYTQKLTWSDCGSSGAQCTWVKVPIDYDEPTGPTTKVRVKVHPGDGATRSLFVNPGGPGGSAIDFADMMFNRFPAEVLKVYDVVGVDPRGVGESSPLECLTDKQFDQFVATDPTPDDDSEVAALRASTTKLGEACVDNSGALAAHVSTVEAARDMDVVRALLGRTEFDWFGASYGTLLGAVYADLFPKEVGRMVLDGAIDPSEDAEEGSFAQTTGFQRALVAYINHCVKSKDCPLGTDPEAAMTKIVDLLKQLDAKPIKAEKGRLLTESQAFFGIAVTLYDEETWDYLTEGLTAAFDGDGSILMQLSDAYFDRLPNGTYGSNASQVIYAINCLDGGKALTLPETEAQIPRFTKASPVFGPALVWGSLGCSDWPIRATNPVPKIDAVGAAPILVLGTTRDPATPYESAEALAGQLSSGVLLTREGDGHTAYLSGNKCIYAAVNAYLVEGTVPAEGTVCKES